jgi:hypothetical protein
MPIIFCCLYQLRSLHYRWKKCLIFSLVLLIPWVAIIGGWQIRNYKMTGSADFSTVQAFYYFYCLGAGVLQIKENISIYEAQHKMALLLPYDKSMSIIDRNKEQTRFALKLIINNPLSFSISCLKGLLITLLGPGSTKFYVWIPDKLIANLLLGLAIIVLYFSYLGILFLIVNIMKEDRNLLIANITIWCIIIYLLLVSSGGCAYSRYRSPIMPFITLYGGHGLVIAFRKYVKGKSYI